MRWIKRGLAGLAVLAVLAFAVVYGGSEWIIRKGRTVPAETVAVPADAASIAEGSRLARVEGCRNCHGAEGKGKVLLDDSMLGRLASPALARVAANYSDADLVRAIRHGVRKDGSTLWVMPTQAYNTIADDDLGKIIAWIRTLKPAADDQPLKMRFGPIGRALVLTGKLPPSVHPEKAAARTRPGEVGQYFVRAVCTGCHALDHAQPSEDGKQTVPALIEVGAAYDAAAFRKLLKTGQGMSNRDLGLMREVAQIDFTWMTPQEADAIHAWLQAEAAKTGPR